MARGRFITFEGGEGSGKSTQAMILAERLLNADIPVVKTREPGGSPQAEEIRKLLVNGEADRWSPMAETLLNFAAREDHLRNVILPSLDQGMWVLCDRFSDSTRAYQGAAGGVNQDFIEELDRQIVGSSQPELTFIFDIPAIQGLERAQARGGPDRYERKGLAFHETLREAFLSIAESDPNRCIVIDGAASIEAVAELVWEMVLARFEVPTDA